MKKRVITMTLLNSTTPCPIGEEVRLKYFGKPFVGYVTARRGNVVEVTEA